MLNIIVEYAELTGILINLDGVMYCSHLIKFFMTPGTGRIGYHEK